MGDGEHNDASASDGPYVWQSLDRLSQLLGLTQKEVLDQIGRGVERLRIGGNTLLRVAGGVASTTSELSSEEHDVVRERRSEALDSQWETVLHEYREGLRERPNELAPRAPESLREELSPEPELDPANEDDSSRMTLRSWSRFPGWFGPLFEPDEVNLR